jgi:4-hydroxy-3-methylbut-2-enyl diphosphate reductase
MKVIVAKTAGFCWGVKRAMDAVLEASVHNNGGVVQTLGPLIHNPQALELIGKRGVSVAEAPEQVVNGTVVIRAHGIPIQDLRGLKERQARGELKIVNATCPEVAKVHHKIKKWSPKGYFTVILGSHGHAESVAHRSFADSGSVIVANLAEAEALTDEQLKKVLVVAQTTFTVKDYQIITDYLRTRAGEAVFENTICEDTWMRQDEARELARTVDSVIVVGGKASSNTKHLAELAQHYGKPVQYVETASELDLHGFTGKETVGVLAGASTPTWLVDEVVDLLEEVGGGPGKLARFMASAFSSPTIMAMGAACTSIGVQHWLGLQLGFRSPLVTGTYVLAMYLLSPFLDPLGLGAKGPGRARFLERHREVLLAVAISALLISLGAAAAMGWKAFLVVAFASLLGVTYRRGLKTGGRQLSLSGLPGAKDFLVAAALGIVVVVMPVWQKGGRWHLHTFAALALVAALGFARTVINDIRDMQNDQVLGRDTLPIAVGKQKAKAILVGVLVGLFVVLLGLTLTTRDAKALVAAGIMALALVHPLAYQWYYHERFNAGRPRFELKPELSFYLLGLLALV